MSSPSLPPVRYRCLGCGNLTRFDVVATRRTRAFHHYSVGGDLVVEDQTVLDEHVDAVECRWCGASGDTIEVLAVDPAAPVGPHPPAAG
ncbi:MAG: hypothetical protein AMXMBFR46_19090 [Acidimicrobiia bacterium]